MNTKGLSIASLVLGIISVIFFSFSYLSYVALVCGILAIVFSVKARGATDADGKTGLATAGLVLGIIGTALSGIIALCVLCVGGTAASILTDLASFLI